MITPNTATQEQPTKTNYKGGLEACSVSRPSNVAVNSEVSPSHHLPGIIIFVHGVNSEGEWYKYAEDALCQGLNERLGLTDEDTNLKPIDYKKRRVLVDGESDYAISKTKNNRSPVIRFYWGYRAKESDLDKYTIPLKNLSGDSYQQQILDGLLTKQQIMAKGPYFWGGGPFQNGCTNLYQLWSKLGFEERIIKKLFSTQTLNPEQDRLLRDAPPREYYAHAAGRLAKLIQKIRCKYPKDTITVMSHSQGTMVASAAALISPPDALFLMNSPYRLFDIVTTDYFAMAEDERLSNAARLGTLKNVIKEVSRFSNKLQASDYKHFSFGKMKTPWVGPKQPTTANPAILERDNHGRTYIYCNAHDRVMGSAALLSIGWQGLPNSKDGKLHEFFADDEINQFIYQRLMARGTPCGDKPNPQHLFGTLPDMVRQSELKKRDGRDDTIVITDWGKPFWDDMEYSIPIIGPTWTTPPRWQTMNINAEQVPVVLTASELANFDEDATEKKEKQKELQNKEANNDKGYGWGQIDPDSNKAIDSDYPYYLPLYQQGQRQRKVISLKAIPENVDSSDAGERARHQNRNQGKLGIENGWVVTDDNNRFISYDYFEDNQQLNERLRQYISRPTDHSSLPSHTEFMRRVAAYDLPVGYCNASRDAAFMDELRRDADWTLSDNYFFTGELDIPAMPKTVLKESIAAENRKKQLAAQIQHMENEEPQYNWAKFLETMDYNDLFIPQPATEQETDEDINFDYPMPTKRSTEIQYSTNNAVIYHGPISLSQMFMAMND